MPEHLPVLNPNISAREFDRLLEEIESERYGDYKRFGDVAAQALAIAEALGMKNGMSKPSCIRYGHNSP